MFINKERNFGCRIKDKYLYKGMRVVVMENELLRLSILLDKGTDIFEFLYKPLDIDFMFVSTSGIRNPNIGLSTNVHSTGFLSDYWEGGWQEMFPSAGAPCYYYGAEFGQHGEVHLLPWDYSILEDNPNYISIKFWVSTYRAPFLLEKTLTMKSKSPILYISEKITNGSSVDVDFMWGHHPVFGYPFLNEGCIVNMPPSKVWVHEISYSDDNNLLPNQRSNWPFAKNKKGEQINLSMLPTINSNTEDLVYITDFNEGWCCVTNPFIKLGIGFAWPKEIFSFIWYWREFNGGLKYPWYRRHYNIGLEPCTSFPGSGLDEAIKNNTARRLKGGESLKFDWLALAFSGFESISNITLNGEVHGV